MLPRFRPLVTPSEILQALDWRSAQLPEIEKAFAEAMGFAQAVWFPQGRTAVATFLEALEGAGKIALSPFNCTALGTAVVASGNLPFYVDTATQGFGEDPHEFQAALAREDVVAGIAVAPWGARAQSYTAQKPILYDYALGGLEAFRPSIARNDAVLYSVGWGKPLSTLKGGFLCADASDTAQRWRGLRDASCRSKPSPRDAFRLAALKVGSHPWTFRLAKNLALKTSWAGSLLGMDHSELSASAFEIPSGSVARMILNRLRCRNALRQERLQQVAHYERLLTPLESEGIQLPGAHTPLSHYPIRLGQADALHEGFLTKGIFTSRDLFRRLLSDYDDFKGESLSDLARARKLCERTLHLPLYFGLSSINQERIVRTAVQWFRKQNRRVHAAHSPSGS